jgi:hypothetical protein
LSELNRLIRMKDVYETQVRKLNEDWKNGNSKFSSTRDYLTQLNLWKMRIAEYEIRIKEYLIN